MKPVNSLPKNQFSDQWSVRLDRHFAACSAAAVGAFAWLGSQNDAQAGIVYSGVVNLPVLPSDANGGVYFDFENPANFSQGPTRPTGWDMNPYATGWAIYMGRPSTGVILSAPDAAANLPLGTLIDASQSFSGATPYNTGFYGDSGVPTLGTGIIGFRFDPETVPGVQTWYGWFRMFAGNNDNQSGTVVDWAYDDTGAGILAGQTQIPEPTSISLLAMGAAGVLALRRRRAQG